MNNLITTKQLVQNRWFDSQILTLDQTKLCIKVSDLFNSRELEIPYEEIILNKISRSAGPNKILLGISLAVCLFIMYMIGAFEDFLYMGIGAVAICIILFKVTYYYQIKNIIVPTYSMGYLLIFDEIPNKSTSDDFLNSLKVNGKNYLINKYGRVDKDMPLEPQLFYLTKLRELEVINQEEYETLKNHALDKDLPSTPIGFTPPSPSLPN